MKFPIYLSTVMELGGWAAVISPSLLTSTNTNIYKSVHKLENYL